MAALSLDRSILFVKDMDRMFTFYTRVLGLQPVTDSKDADWRVLDSGGAELALHLMPAHWGHQVQIKTPPEPRESAVTKMVFQVDDLAGVCADLKAQDVSFIDNPYLNPPGEFVRADFIDPEGNVVQLSLRGG